MNVLQGRHQQIHSVGSTLSCTRCPVVFKSIITLNVRQHSVDLCELLVPHEKNFDGTFSLFRFRCVRREMGFDSRGASGRAQRWKIAVKLLEEMSEKCFGGNMNDERRI